MDFGEALEALKNGLKVKRANWGGYWFVADNPVGGEWLDKESGSCRQFSFNQMIVAKLKDNGGYVPPTAYQEDLLAEDWEVVE